ncbi:sigma-70 family RNA polymerase sigma factor [Bacillus sp. 1P02SD]|uniref:sigma-70 family RNA polymerase sigma factor n=1 Tax=Bacillus sp. 1P02SD TaxID=3132264 RepID=UPI0039A180D6
MKGGRVLNISKLVAKAKKGNNRAFQELIDTEKTKLYKMAYLYMKNEDDALEVFQETVYKALTSLKDLKNDTYFSTWITRILINTAIDQLRRKKRVIPMERDFLESKAPSYTDKEADSDLLNAIKGLDEKYKTVLVLRFYKDFTIKQIAEFLDCPEGTVKTNIHRGIALLRDQLKEVIVNE